MTLYFLKNSFHTQLCVCVSVTWIRSEVDKVKTFSGEPLLSCFMGCSTNTKDMKTLLQSSFTGYKRPHSLIYCLFILKGDNLNRENKKGGAQLVIGTMTDKSWYQNLLQTC